MMEAGEIEVRWGLEADEERVSDLLELNGVGRWVAFEERFIVAERGGEVLAALRYRTEPKKLVVGLLVVDPWAGERALARRCIPGPALWRASLVRGRCERWPGMETTRRKPGIDGGVAGGIWMRRIPSGGSGGTRSFPRRAGAGQSPCSALLPCRSSGCIPAGIAGQRARPGSRGAIREGEVVTLRV